MINRVNGYTFMCCDGCDDAWRLGRGMEFKAQVRQAVKGGWKVILDGKQWRHFCHDCTPVLSSCCATDDLFDEGHDDEQ